MEDLVLEGKHIRLEPLDGHHVDALVAAAGVDAELYRWSPVPQGRAEAANYVHTALGWKEAGTAVPFAIVRRSDGVVIGSTRFWNLERWAWPEGHPSHGRSTPDACEIGYTWLTKAAIRTAANSEGKFLMLRYAFETWRVLRVSFHTDSRNQRSRENWSEVGRSITGASHGRGFHSPGFDPILDRCGGVARSEGEPFRETGTREARVGGLKSRA